MRLLSHRTAPAHHSLIVVEKQAALGRKTIVQARNQRFGVAAGEIESSAGVELKQNKE